MRSRNAFDPRLIAALVTTAAIALAPSASAAPDDKKACSDAYDRTQSLRLKGQLQAAQEQAALCTRDACAEFIRTDCTTWLGQIEAGLPTVVFEVRDLAGKDTTAVTVTLDGKPWLTTLSGKARPIDPGTHALRFTIAGAPPIEQTVVVREGEKLKKVSVAFGAAPALPSAPPALAPVAPAPVPVEEEDDAPIAPWVIGGVGLGLLATGGILAAVVASEKSTFDEHCDEATQTCDADGLAAGDTGRTLGPLATVSLVLGAVGVGVATVWIVSDATDESATSTSVGTGPVVHAGGGGWGLRGRFQ